MDSKTNSQNKLSGRLADYEAESYVIEHFPNSSIAKECLRKRERQERATRKSLLQKMDRLPVQNNEMDD